MRASSGSMRTRSCLPVLHHLCPQDSRLPRESAERFASTQPRPICTRCVSRRALSPSYLPRPPGARSSRAVRAVLVAVCRIAPCRDFPLHDASRPGTPPRLARALLAATPCGSFLSAGGGRLGGGCRPATLGSLRGGAFQKVDFQRADALLGWAGDQVAGEGGVWEGEAMHISRKQGAPRHPSPPPFPSSREKGRLQGAARGSPHHFCVMALGFGFGREREARERGDRERERDTRLRALRAPRAHTSILGGEVKSVLHRRISPFWRAGIVCDEDHG